MASSLAARSLEMMSDAPEAAGKAGGALSTLASAGGHGTGTAVAFRCAVPQSRTVLASGPM